MKVNSRRRVVLVAPEFPPANSAGAHRPRLFAKHLPAFGWTPTVLTVRPEQIEGPVDPMLERLLDPALTIVRTAAIPHASPMSGPPLGRVCRLVVTPTDPGPPAETKSTTSPSFS